MSNWFMNFRNEKLNKVCMLAMKMENRIHVMLKLCDSKVMPPLDWFLFLRRSTEHIFRELISFASEEYRDEIKQALALLRSEIDKRWEKVGLMREFDPGSIADLLMEYSKFLGFIEALMTTLAEEIKFEERVKLGTVLHRLVGIEKKPRVRKVGVPITQEGA